MSLETVAPRKKGIIPAFPARGMATVGRGLRKALFVLVTSICCLAPLGVWGEVHFSRIARREKPWKVTEDQQRSYLTNDIAVRSFVPGLSYRNHPGGHGAGEKMNTWGYHDDEFVTPKPKDVYRIAIVGDSMTYGAAVTRAETYSNRLEQMLNESERPRRFDVANLGVPGYQVTQSYSTARHVALPLLEPDLIIYAFYGNDFCDTDINFYRYNRSYPLLCLEDQGFPDDGETDGSWEKRLRFFLSTNSALYAELRYRSGILRYEKILPAVRQARRALPAGRLKNAFEDGLLLLPYFYPHVPACADYRFTATAIRAMAELAKDHGARFMILSIPVFDNLAGEDRERIVDSYMEFFAARNRDLPIYSAHEDVRRIMQARGWSPAHLRVSAVDDHPSALGHESIAEGLYEYLTTRKGLLD